MIRLYWVRKFIAHSLRLSGVVKNRVSASFKRKEE
jgi:hypothetical protein